VGCGVLSSPRRHRGGTSKVLKVKVPVTRDTWQVTRSFWGDPQVVSPVNVAACGVGELYTYTERMGKFGVEIFKSFDIRRRIHGEHLIDR